MTHICVGKVTIIGSDNGLSSGRQQAIIWTNFGILLIGPLGTNFGEILIEIQTFSLRNIRLKMSPAKCCPFRRGHNVEHEDDSQGTPNTTPFASIPSWICVAGKHLIALEVSCPKLIWNIYMGGDNISPPLNGVVILTKFSLTILLVRDNLIK